MSAGNYSKNYSTPYNGPSRIVPLDERRAIIQTVMGQNVDWVARDGGEWGYCECPGLANHSQKNGKRDCRVWAIENGSKPPGVHCLHTSCAAAVDEMSHKIRSAIGKAKADVPDAKRSKPAFAPARGTWRPSANAMHEKPAAKATGRPPTCSPGNGVSTVRTPVVCNPEGGQSQFRTLRTDILNPLSHYARAQVRARAQACAQSNVPDHPSEPSGSCAPVAESPQPVAIQPRPTEGKPPAIYEPAPGVADDYVTIITGDTVQKGRWVKGNWVPLKK